MVSDVEGILKQIQDQVRAEADAASPRPANGGAEVLPAAHPGDAEAMARVSAHLTTTGRAWDRLPPIFSNRSGVTAKFEIWIKARLKSMTRWFTWEQINFNSAVHHALSDTLATLQAQELQLQALRTAMHAMTQELSQRLDQEEAHRRAANDQIHEQIHELRGAIEDRAVEIRQQARALQEHHATLESWSRAADEHAKASDAAYEELKAWLKTQAHDTAGGMAHLADGLNARLAEVAADLREEQRVCYKQLSLEATEAAVAAERDRQLIEFRLASLEKQHSGKS